VDCRSVVAELDEIRQATTSMKALEPPPVVWYRVRDEVSRRPSRPRFAWAWAGAAAAALLVAVYVGSRLPAFQVRAAGPEALLSRSRTAASAELTAHYREYLAGVDAAIAETELALAENPSNPRVRMAHLEARAARARTLNQLYAGGD